MNHRYRLIASGASACASSTRHSIAVLALVGLSQACGSSERDADSSSQLAIGTSPSHETADSGVDRELQQRAQEEVLADAQPQSKGDPLAGDSELKPTPAAGPAPRTPDVVYVPTPQPVVDKMLELAKVKKGDVVYDLGCGDGRIVVTAAKKYGARAKGFDVDPQRIKEAKKNVEDAGVGDLATIEQADIFTLDLSDADVVTLYLLPELNVRLIPQLQKLKKGARIVSHDFDMQGVAPLKQMTLKPPAEERTHEIFLWHAPIRVTPDEVSAR